MSQHSRPGTADSPWMIGSAGPSGRSGGATGGDLVPTGGEVDGTPAGTGGAAPGGGWASLVRLVVVVAAIVGVAVALHGGDLVLVLGAVVLMITLHELGHFFTAKWSGMKVTECFLGFGPRLWSVRRGETEYGIKAIPAGAYVKIVGMSNLEEVDPADEPRTYRQQPFRNRLLVAVAGSAMQMLLALVALWGLLVFSGVPQTGAVSVQGFAPLAHGADPARAAGLRPGDVVTGAAGHRLPSSGAASAAQALVDVISSHAGRPVRLTVEQGGAARSVVVVPAPVQVVGVGGHVTTEGRIGVEIGAGPNQVVNPLRAVGTAANDLGRVVSSSVSAIQTTFSLHGLSGFFSQLGNSRAAARAAKAGTRPESIYGAIRTATQGARAGPNALIAVLVSIDVFVGLANLFPMLPLDGGHVLVAVYERIRSRKGRRYVADVAKLTPVAYAFVLFLLVFVGSALFLDITHPVANPFG